MYLIVENLRHYLESDEIRQASEGSIAPLFLGRRFAENEQYIVSSWLDDQGPKGFQFSSSSAVFGKERESSSLTHAARVTTKIRKMMRLIIQLRQGSLNILFCNCNVCIRGVVQTSQFTTSFLLPFDHLFRTDSETSLIRREFSCMSNLVGIKYVHPITISQYQRVCIKPDQRVFSLRHPAGPRITDQNVGNHTTYLRTTRSYIVLCTCFMHTTLDSGSTFPVGKTTELCYY